MMIKLKYFMLKYKSPCLNISAQSKPSPKTGFFPFTPPPFWIQKGAPQYKSFR